MYQTGHEGKKHEKFSDHKMQSKDEVTTKSVF